MRQAGLAVPVRKNERNEPSPSARAKLGISIWRERPMKYPTAALKKVKGQSKWKTRLLNA